MTYATVTLTGTYKRLDGTPERGSVTIQATSPVIVDDTGDLTLTGTLVIQLDVDGHFSIALPATDDPSLEPVNFGYTVSVRLGSGSPITNTFTLPAADPVVDITDIVTTDPSTFQPNADFVTQSELDPVVTRVTNLENTTVDDGELAVVSDSVTNVETRVTALEGNRATTTDLANTQAEVDALELEVAGLAVGTYKKAKLPPNWGIYAYGNSYGVLAAGWTSAGQTYLHHLSEELEAASLTSYAVGAQRTIHALYSLVQGVAPATAAACKADSKMPTDDSRKGLMILETLGNDIGHYPDMSVSPVVPAKITNADYTDSLHGMYRLAIAIASGGTRVECNEGTFTGTWTNTAYNLAYTSGGVIPHSTSVGATVEVSVTPPQQGPLAGKVFLSTVKYATGTAVNANFDVFIDGELVTTATPGQWESYLGVNGAKVGDIFHGTEISLPVDGTAHTVKLVHAGVAGQWFAPDFIMVPSENPNPVIIPGCERAPVPHAAVFDQAGVDVWSYNMGLVNAVAKAVCAEFPNAFYVPSTVTENGLYSGDGLHLNDRGQRQRANDVSQAIELLVKAYFQNITLGAAPDTDFATI